MAAAMLATCVLALAETAHTAEAEESLPENGKIAFTRDSRIYTVEPDGSNLRKLTNNTYFASKPVWSPDGTEIAFGRQGINSSDVSISIISADGSDLSDPYTGTNYNPGSTWSPDGTKLAFGSFGVSQDSNPSNDIYMMDADGSNLVNLTKSPGLNENDMYPRAGNEAWVSTSWTPMGPAPNR
jgi:Tol biopolymer transport system component